MNKLPDSNVPKAHIGNIFSSFHHCADYSKEYYTEEDFDDWVKKVKEENYPNHKHQPDRAEPTEQYSELEEAVMRTYPKFQNHYPIMLEKCYFERKDDGHLRWLKQKKCLAQYFGNLPHTLKQGRWKLVEELFELDNLQSSFSSDPYKKDSSDYVNLKILLNIQ